MCRSASIILRCAGGVVDGGAVAAEHAADAVGGPVRAGERKNGACLAGAAVPAVRDDRAGCGVGGRAALLPSFWWRPKLRWER